MTSNVTTPLTYQACDQCRTRKAKCDEGRPSCSHCKENNLPCVYKEVPPHKCVAYESHPSIELKLTENRQEKATQLLLDRMQQLEDRLEERMTQLQSIQVEQGSQLSRMATEPKVKETRVMPAKETVRPASQKQAVDPMKPEIPDVLREQETKEQSTSYVVSQKIDAAEAVDEGLKDDDDGELSIPVEHTTAAHKLLMWPTIRALIFPRQYDEDYVMKLEENRGLIRVYGRGEGDDTSEDRDAHLVPNQNPSASATPTWDEPYPHGTSPSGGHWAGGGTTPAASSSFKPLHHGVEESGVFTTDAETVRRLHQSYMDHLHKLHPFLDQNDLEKKLEWFIRVYCPRGPSGATVSIMNNAEFPRGAKRKRSCETMQGASCDVPSPDARASDQTAPPRIEQSIDNAIILLVLALGSICECRDRPVPGPVRDDVPDYRQETIPGPSTSRSILSPAGSDSALPMSSSFYAPTSSHSFPSPAVVDNRKSGMPPVITLENGESRPLRNMDVIPGLAYYGYATQILGSLQGANRLPHVQAALLAGLYAGQLAHPFQSHGWIYQAARACQVLVRS